jgi:hypothetical protein
MHRDLRLTEAVFAVPRGSNIVTPYQHETHNQSGRSLLRQGGGTDGGTFRGAKPTTMTTQSAKSRYQYI